MVQKWPSVQSERCKRPLLPHQKNALQWSLERTSIALFMEMRLGKTKVIIERFRNEPGQILVIAPLSTLRSWANELELEEEYCYSLLIGSKKNRIKELNKGERWNLVNFEGLNSCPQILEHKWSTVIIDESAKLRNPKTKTSKNIATYFQNVKNKAILSGLPAPESPLDYFQQFKFLNNHFMSYTNFWQFRNVSCFNPYKYKWILRSGWKEQVRKHVQNHSFILSRKDAGLGNVKIREIRTIPLDPKQKVLMERIEKEFVLDTGESLIETKWVPVTWVWLAQVAGGFVNGAYTFSGKEKELIDLLQGELKTEQVVVWFRFNQELEQIHKTLDGLGIPHGRLWGKMDEEERWEAIQFFQQKETRVLLCQMKVGLYGLDLSCASTAIYYSNGFSEETRSQTEDRIEHPKKKEPLLIIDLVTENSIDEDIIKALKKKHETSQYYLKREILNNMRERVNS